jgi:secreted trypsin-like serine protease
MILLRPSLPPVSHTILTLLVGLATGLSGASRADTLETLRVETKTSAAAPSGSRPATLPSSDEVPMVEISAERLRQISSNPKALPYSAAGIDLKTGGIAKKGANEKIVGGQQAAAGSYPFQAGILRLMKTNGKVTGLNPMCGGTVLTSRWILSAAHCFVEGEGGKILGLRSTKDLFVHVGNTNLLAKESERDWVPVKRIVAHPKYVTGTNVNDIALVELERSPRSGVAFEQVTVVTPETEADDLPLKAELAIVGWGTTAEGGKPSVALMESKLNAVDRGLCNKVLTTQLARSSEANKALDDLAFVFNMSPANRRALEQNLPQFGGVVTPQMFCAGAAVNGIDTCQGDSGGPILHKNADGSMVQVGIVSFGIGCGHAELPGVYTRLALYTDWMKQTVAAANAAAPALPNAPQATKAKP